MLKSERKMAGIMETDELLKVLKSGETSKVQFKDRMPHRDSVVKEIVAMANSGGGMIAFGVEDVTGNAKGLSPEEVEEYDNAISQIADNVRPPIYITSEVVDASFDDTPRNVLIINVPDGINKPYKTDKGEIFVKQGANKRLLVDNAEIMRMFQQGGNLLADEMEVYDTSIADIDERRFSTYFKREFGMSFVDKGLSYEEALRAKRVLRNGRISLAGLLFFGIDPQSIRPTCTIKVVSYFGNDSAGSNYRTKPADLRGTIPELFEKCMDWLRNNLKSVQRGQGFNSIGKLEIDEEALIELVQNALVHRDYFKNAPVRVMIFDNRVEIRSPGRLPNSLTVDDIKYGNPIVRNNQIVAFASRTMPFSGLGTGVKRALERQPDIEFVNDVAGEQFAAIIPRSNIPNDFSVEHFEPINRSKEPINEPINRSKEPINEPMSLMIARIIANTPGISKPQLVAKIGKSRATVTRVLSLLRSMGKIEYRGSKKTGGYYLK